MSGFNRAELEYLNGERRLGRLATADETGRPHVTPVGMWRYDAQSDSIDIGGHGLSTTRKYRNVGANPHAAFVVDDIASVDPWRPRAVIVKGPAVALLDDGRGKAVIRITPMKVISWGLETD